MTPTSTTMKFCSNCGSTVDLQIPAGDNLPRYMCRACGAIHYQNPKIVTGCVPVWQNEILLCKRAIEPRLGFWTIPAGFMENGETLEEAAQRETHEEACAEVAISGLYAVWNLPHVNQVYVIFRAQLITKKFASGSESLDVGLFKRDDIPWRQMAFPVITQTLKRYFDDRPNEHYPPFIDTITPKR